MIKVGCCGYPVSRKKYYETFNVIEIQKTFCSLPSVELASKWFEESTNDFEFTIKAWQLITHEPSSPTYRKAKVSIPDDKKERYGSFKPTDEVFKAWEETEKIASTLEAKIIVFQCPASFKPTDENKDNLVQFFTSLDKKNFIFAWEPRGKWTGEEIKTLCKELNLVDCVDPFKRKETHGDIKYYRLHGKGGYKYKYSDRELHELFSLAKADKPNYVMFNNVYMFDDAVKFKRNYVSGGLT